MTRISTVDPRAATGETKQLLDAVHAQLGATPNLFRTLARSPTALSGFLALHAALEAATIDKATRERIALAIAEANDCGYCLAAHTTIGRHAGLANDEMARNRRGGSTDPKAAAAIAFARAVNAGRGDVTDLDFDAVRRAGHDDAEIVEIVAVVALNVFTNYLNKAARTEIDFPRAPALTAAA
jgi:uncharacterized peroxidase-related enzyme